jgi:molybdopterin-guanine dinucleotide biosynthesis protein A
VDPVIVVGPRRPGVPGVGWAREDPPGGGPVAALAAGLAALPPGPAIVVVLAGDLIGIRSSTVDKLVGALAAEAGADGAVLVDADGRWQWLIGAWRGGPLHAALPSSPGGASIRKTLAPLTIVTVPESPGESADVDTPADLDRHRAVKDGQLTDSSQPSHRPSS